MEELRDYLVALSDRYRKQPAEWEASFKTIEETNLRRAPAADEWSPHQVIAHVMAADRNALQPRLRRIMEEDQPKLANWDEQAWMADSYQAQSDLAMELAEWKEQRQQLAEKLAGAGASVWNRTGWHPLRGQRTLLWWLEYAVNHAANHQRQLADIVKALNHKSTGAGNSKEAT